MLTFSVAQGCASSEPKLADDIAALKAQVWSLQKQTAELGLKVSYSSDEVALLSERLKNLEEEVRSSAVSKPGPGTKPAKPSVVPAPGIEEPTPAPSSETKPEKQVVAQVGPVPRELGPGFKDLKPDQMYKTSMEHFNSGAYQTAIEGFRYLVRRYPGSGLAPNAQYWIGEAFYNLKRFARAGEEFKKVLVRYPGSQKAPDTLLKIGLCKVALGRDDEGKETLRQVIEKYPESVAATTARDMLAEGGAKK